MWCFFCKRPLPWGILNRGNPKIIIMRAGTGILMIELIAGTQVEDTIDALLEEAIEESSLVCK